MWFSKEVFEMLAGGKQQLQDALATQLVRNAEVVGQIIEIRSQKVKDDLTIDWMRHRVNALEKERAQLMMKVAGVHLPIPELVSTRPGTMSALPDFDFTPSFESMSDAEAARLGITHDEAGQVVYSERK